ncbi:NAD(P)H-dependent oxidoreductase [Bacteroidota bacterium]
MKKILAFTGSPRNNGNSTILLESFLSGIKEHSNKTEIIDVHNINLKYCTGCLRCNILGRCSISDDDWPTISKKIEDSDILVFSSPIYFHHVPAALKKVIDRFRSFVKVQITETGLNHTPWKTWKKDFVLLLTMGSSDVADAKPVRGLFEFMKSILGSENKLHVITATRLAVTKQIIKNEEELKDLYRKLKLPEKLINDDYMQNMQTLDKCFKLGKKLVK